MSIEFFIAKRIYKGDIKNNKQVSSPAIKIAIIGIALGLAVMLMSVSIIIGFKKEIRDKVVGFGSHIQISGLGSRSELEENAIVVSDSLKQILLNHPEIKHAQEFIVKPGIIKTLDDFLGVLFKGVNHTYDWSFFSNNMKDGLVIADTNTVDNQVIISKIIADKLHLQTGDKFVAYFVQDPVRARQFHVSGVYETNFEDYDKLYVIAESNVLAKLNGWDEDMYSGIELFVSDYNKLDQTSSDLFYDLIDYKDRLENTLYAQSIKDINPMIFNWLNLLDMNVWIILFLMILVSGFTMTSGLLIIILERTNMIGILKALGSGDYSIRKVFIFLSAFLIGKGMIWGNLIALSFCFLQKYFQLIKLNPSIYYLSSVPIDLNVWYFVLVNTGTLLVSLLMMLAPSYLVTKLTPAKSIRFE